MIRAEIDKGTYEPEKTVKYPYIGVLKSGLTVLFTSPRSGVLLKAGHTARSDWDYSSCWHEEKFTPLAEGESVTLSNVWEIVND